MAREVLEWYAGEYEKNGVGASGGVVFSFVVPFSSFVWMFETALTWDAVNWYRNREVNFKDELKCAPPSVLQFASFPSWLANAIQAHEENNRCPSLIHPSDERRGIASGYVGGNGGADSEFDEEGGQDGTLGVVGGTRGGQWHD